MERQVAIDRALGAAMLVVTLAGCGSDGGGEPSAASPGTRPATSATPSQSPKPSPTPTPSPQMSSRPAIGAVPPPWLGTRILPETTEGFGEVRPTPPELEQRRFTLPDQLPPLPGRGFTSRVTTPAPAEVIARSTWKRGCPVSATDLAWVRVAFWGFDQRRHTGELLVNRAVAADMVSVFRGLYTARFPIEEMRITRLDELVAPPTGDGNNTGAFACRLTTGTASSYSEHAYGLAVDVNPFQNPYLKGDLVLPELASSYLDRSWARPGVVTPGGPATRAFDEIGWPWGGAWQSLKDYQHFSRNGR